jgi:hypothetical protein
MWRELYRINDKDVQTSKLKSLEKYLNKQVHEYIIENFTFDSDVAVLDSESIFNIDVLDKEQDGIVNIHRINDIRWVNKYFEAINAKLNNGGLLIGSVETYRQRKIRILSKYNPVIEYPAYWIDFLVKRVFPKLKLTQWLYFVLTRGHNRAISRAEAFGRLYSCGFEFVSEKEIENVMYFVFKKVSSPKYDTEPTYGPFVKLKRIGKNGKEINVRKFRTMYAYSEYLQGLVYEYNDLASGGKFKDDFRVTNWGKFMRKFWIDEYPMLWNVLKGELKIVGVRPLSKHYYNLYDEDLKKMRVKVKPGLVPPYYVDMPKTLEEIQDSERRYLEAYEKNPWKTQWKYFGKAMYNILIKRARSS